MQGARRTDLDIQRDVAHELARDQRVSPTELDILQVNEGIVILGGEVDSWAKHRAADEVAHRVLGVVGVVNDLTVKIPGSAERPDADIAQAVRHALECDTLVPAGQVQIIVSHGAVSLEGEVAYYSQRYDAEKAVERLPGVKRVINRIAVKPNEPVDVDDARKAVEKVLEQHANREADRIVLSDVNGEVQVTGVVHTAWEKEAVLGAVRGARGVRSVIDHLRVRG